MGDRVDSRERTWPFFLVALGALLWVAPDSERYLGNADHGYQLSMARMLVLGGVPCVDFVFHYGPLVALTSGLALWLSGSLLGETLVCALGYAGSLTLLARVCCDRLGRGLGLLMPLVAFLLMARFYKWYFWLFPAASLYLAHRLLPVLPAGGPPRRVWLLAGLVAGMGGLYRLDVGVILLVAFLILASARVLTGGSSGSALRSAGEVVLGFSVPLLAWLAGLVAVAGTGAVEVYISAALDGGSGVVAGWSKGPPDLEGSGVFAPQFGLLLALGLLPMTYAVCLGIGGVRGFLGDEPDPSARYLAAVAVFGFGMMPQAVYRADYQHLLQVLPSLFVAAPLLIQWGWRRSRVPGAGRGAFVRIALVFYVALLGIAGVGLSNRAGADLSPLRSNPVARLARLGQGLAPDVDSPIARVSREIMRRSAPADPILVVPLAPQIYFFAQRPMSGVLNIYAHDILDGPRWRKLTLEHIRRNVPRLVVARKSLLDSNHPDTVVFRASQPELHAYLSSRYTRVVFEAEGWLLLEQAEAANSDDARLGAKAQQGWGLGPSEAVCEEGKGAGRGKIRCNRGSMAHIRSS